MIALPRDANNIPIQMVPPAKTAIAVTYDATISSATDLNLQSSTTFLEVSAILKGVFLRYQATASSTNFDEFIPADTTAYFVVPSGVTVISVIEEAASAHVAIVEK